MITLITARDGCVTSNVVNANVSVQFCRINYTRTERIIEFGKLMSKNRSKIPKSVRGINNRTLPRFLLNVEIDNDDCLRPYGICARCRVSPSISRVNDDQITESIFPFRKSPHFPLLRSSSSLVVNIIIRHENVSTDRESESKIALTTFGGAGYYLLVLVTIISPRKNTTPYILCIIYSTGPEVDDLRFFKFSILSRNRSVVYFELFIGGGGDFKTTPVTTAVNDSLG